jgi:hypothetical protein
MPVVTANKIQELAQAADPKKAILAAVGDLSKQDVFTDLVLVGTYIRNERTAGGIIRPIDNVKEDEYQGKVGLVLKKGPDAHGFDPMSGIPDSGGNAVPGSWVVYAIKDGWPVQINGMPCRFVPYSKLRMRITDPNLVF